ncbi:MAG: outer membrane protein assembly factor BamD [bacterium]|nr:outer membrane protein assembly factor BamD [bacterium]
MNNAKVKTALITLLAAASLSGIWGCGGSANMSGMPARQLFNLGMEKYQSEKYIRAIEAFQTVVYNYPGAALIDSAQYYLALSYYGNKDHALAGVEFNRLLLNYPSSVFAPHSQLMKAVCYFEGTPGHYGLDQSDLQIAIRQFEDFLIDYPESEAVEDCRAYLKTARTRLARKHYSNGIVYVRVRDYRAARVYFQKVIDEFTETEYAALSTYETAGTYLSSHEWDKAHEQYENFKTVFSDHQLAPKAAEQSCEAIWKGGKEAFEQEDFALARTRLERFLTACGHETDRLEEVNELLKRIEDSPLVEALGEDAGS